MSLHSLSISSRMASRQARSWGESTSTPSTSNMAPRKLMAHPLLVLAPARLPPSRARGSTRRSRGAGEQLQSLAGDAEQRHVAHDDVDGYPLEHGPETAGLRERVHERGRPQDVAERLRDPAGQVDAAEGEDLQRQVGGLRAQYPEEEREGGVGERVRLGGEGGLDDRPGAIVRRRQLLREPLRFGQPALVAKEVVEVRNADARRDA